MAGDDGMHLCGVIGSENELQEWLKSFFEKHGWIAVREESPQNSSCRADLIVNHDEYGWFGIETKYFDDDGGDKLANAHHQIVQKYRGKKYIGHRINCWAVCPYFCQQRGLAKFIREFFCRHGIGYVNLDRRQLLLDFAYSQRYAKVPVGGEYLEKHIDGVDVEKIRERVERMQQEYAYS